MWVASTKTMPMHCMYYHQVTYHIEAEWRFDLKDDNRDKTGWVYINQKTYDAYKIGDWYNNDST